MNDLAEEPETPADFFEAGKTYVDTDPNTPPENLAVFHTAFVGPFPNSEDGTVMAFGFITTVEPPEHHWQVHLFLKPNPGSPDARSFQASWKEREL